MSIIEFHSWRGGLFWLRTNNIRDWLMRNRLKIPHWNWARATNDPANWSHL
jgi:hypothetical protein